MNDDYRDILQSLLDAEADFIVVGAYAMAAHGYPRATGDLDIWVNPNAENSRKVYDALIRFGAPLSEITENDFCEENIIFQIGIIPRRIDIITSIDGVTYKDAKQDVLLAKIDNLSIPVLSLKKIIINKESTGREKDKLDSKILKKLL